MNIIDKDMFRFFLTIIKISIAKRPIILNDLVIFGNKNHISREKTSEFIDENENGNIPIPSEKK